MVGAPGKVLRCGYCGAAWDRRYLNCPWCGTFQPPSNREWVRVHRKEVDVRHDSGIEFYAVLVCLIATSAVITIWSLDNNLMGLGVLTGLTSVLSSIYLIYCLFWEYDHITTFIAEDGRVFHLEDGVIHELNGDLYMELY